MSTPINLKTAVYTRRTQGVETEEYTVMYEKNGNYRPLCSMTLKEKDLFIGLLSKLDHCVNAVGK